jgi:hypothetical protein
VKNLPEHESPVGGGVPPRDIREANLKSTDEEGRQMIAGGMKVVELTGAARAAFLEKASRVSWERMQKRDPGSVAALRQKFGD